MFLPVTLAERWTEVEAGAQPGVLLVREGAALLGTREYILRLPAGSVLVVAAGETLRLRAAHPGVAPLLLHAPCTAAGPDAPALLPQLHDPDSELAGLLAGLPDGDADALHARVLQAQHGCLALIERCSGRSFERRREQYLRLARARAVLAWGESARLDVAHVAEIARLSPHYFVERFHRVFGVSPHQYRIDRRMQEARRLVAQTRQPIREILNQLGLDSHSTFTRVFRRQFGMSATSLRAQNAARPRD